MAKKPKTNRGGRPKKPTSEKRSEQIAFNVTVSERDAIVSAAGENVSKWCRDSLLRLARRTK